MDGIDFSVADDLMVSLDYTLRLDDGEVADSTEGREPLEYLHGRGQLIQGLERELYGLKVGDSKSVTVEARDACGERNPQRTQRVPRDAFPQGADLRTGAGVRMHDQHGRTVIAYVAELGADDVLLDLNHPLAGRTLHFDVSVSGLREPTDDELTTGSGCCGSCHSCGSGGCCG